MEWLIDTIKEWVIKQAYATEAWVLERHYATVTYVKASILALEQWVTAQGYLTTSFVDRGDPAAVDWTEATLTIDSAWHDLDLSGIVPAGAKAVVLRVIWLNTLILKRAKFRKKGNVNDINTSEIITVVGDIRISGDKTVALDENRIIEYNIDKRTAPFIDVTVAAWWL